MDGTCVYKSKFQAFPQVPGYMTAFE